MVYSAVFKKLRSVAFDQIKSKFSSTFSYQQEKKSYDISKLVIQSGIGLGDRSELEIFCSILAVFRGSTCP